MLIENTEYNLQLNELWQEVFGDSKEAVDIFFEMMFDTSHCFAHLQDTKITSWLYLLPCKIKFDSQIFSGAYLFAAGTKKEYRRKGIMSTLINEAQDFAKNQGLDFISLVPANETLYSYYEKFGFQTAMHKVMNTSKNQGLTVAKTSPLNAEQVYDIRSSFEGNFFIWDRAELRYVLRCLSFYDIKPMGSQKKYFLLDEKHDIILELMSKEKMTDFLPKAQQIFSPFEIKGCVSEKIKFGMIFPINKKLNRKWNYEDIYMNLALD